jgi:hypothetical protein
MEELGWNVPSEAYGTTTLMDPHRWLSPVARIMAKRLGNIFACGKHIALTRRAQWCFENSRAVHGRVHD